MLGLLVQWNVGRIEIIFMIISEKKYKVKERLCRKIQKKLVYKYKVTIGVGTENYQWKVLLLNIFQIQFIQEGMKQNHNLIHI